LRGLGAYPIRATIHGTQDESTHHEEDDEIVPITNDERNKAALSSDDPESALEAQVVPERDLNREVQQKMEAITIDPIAVATSKPNNDVLNNGPPSALRKSTLMNALVILMVLVAVGSTIGVLASKDKKDPSPTLAPTVMSDLKLARAIFIPLLGLSGNEALWDESSPQYKALWWIVHDDPAKMIMKMQDETQSSSDMIVERYAMAVLYFATAGANWIQQLNFLGNSSICDWYDSMQIEKGVSCNDEGSAVTLRLGTFLGLCCLQSILIAL
jgi:hypothetical protein